MERGVLIAGFQERKGGDKGVGLESWGEGGGGGGVRVGEGRVGWGRRGKGKRKENIILSRLC